MTNLKQRLKELREISEKASEGVWEVEDYRHNGDWRSAGLIWAKKDPESYVIGKRVCSVNCDKLHAGSPPEEIAEFEANAAFIATSRSALPALLDAVEALVEALEHVKGRSIGCSPCRSMYEYGEGGHFSEIAEKALSHAEALLTGGKGNG